MSRQQRSPDSRLVHHELNVADSGAAVTSVGFSMGGLIVAAANTVNPCAPRAMRLRRIGAHSGCLVVNSAGNWTLRIRKNESGSDSATFTLGVGALPGTKNSGVPSSQFIMDAGDTYHMLADGPSRNFVVIRVILEWEVL